MKQNEVSSYFAQFVTIVCRITDSHLYAGRMDDAIRVVDYSLQIADNNDIYHKDLIRLLLQSGKLLNKHSFFGNSKFEKTMKILSRAQQMATAIGDQELLATALLYLGQAYDYQSTNTGNGDYQDAFINFGQALTLFQTANIRRGEGKAIFNIGLIHQRRRDLEEAKACFTKAYDIAVQGGYRFDQSLAIRHLGFIYFSASDYELAEECAKESLKLREELNYRLYLPPAHHILGSLYIVQNDWENALVHLERANDLAKELKLTAYKIQIQLTLGEWHKRQGNKENARDCFQKAYDIAVELKQPRWQEAAKAEISALLNE